MDDGMAWYHWIAIYTIIIGATIFTIIPEKPLWLWGAIFLAMFVGLLGGFLPPKGYKYTKKEG